MDEAELRKEDTRGQKAKALLENPLFREAFDEVDAHLVQIWRDAKDEKVREDTHRAISMLPHLKSAIEAHVQKGMVARKKLEEMVKPKRRPF